MLSCGFNSIFIIVYMTQDSSKQTSQPLNPKLSIDFALLSTENLQYLNSILQLSKNKIKKLVVRQEKNKPFSHLHTVKEI